MTAHAYVTYPDPSLFQCIVICIFISSYRE